MLRSVRVLAVIWISALLLTGAYLIGLYETQGERLAAHPRNPRIAAAENSILRGGIYARDGEPIAQAGAGLGERVYLGPKSLSHVVGYAHPRYGKPGLEAAFDRVLVGLEPRPGILRVLWSRGVAQGNSIELTIDLSVQRAAERAMQGVRGAAVVLDPRSGEVLAQVSSPWFDANRLDESWQSLSQSKASPLLDRATSGRYPPGSTLKPFIAAVGLESGVVSRSTKYTCTGGISVDGQVIRDYGGEAHGEVDLARAIAVSCNSYFADLGIRLDPMDLVRGAEEFLLTRSDFYDLQLARPEFPGVSKLGEGARAQVSIGQGSVAVTPIHMALLAAAVANGGVIMRPHLVRRIISPEGRTLKTFRPREIARPMSSRIARQIADGMKDAVRYGTAKGAAIPNVEVAGKTGTAENPRGQPHAWFIGYAPADDPRAVVAVVVENGGSGGAVAAPRARDILRAALSRDSR